MRYIVFSILLITSIRIASGQYHINAVAMKNGCRILSAPESYIKGEPDLKVFPGSAQSLIDENDSLGWKSAKSLILPDTFLFELSQPYKLEEFIFNNECGSSSHGSCVKDLKIEISQKGPQTGFELAGNFNIQEFATSCFILNLPPARWVRLVILSNYGNRKFTQLMEFKAIGQPAGTNRDKINLAGTWKAGNQKLSLNQSGDKIQGCYFRITEGNISGNIKGRTFKGTWSGNNDGKSGWTELTLNQEADRLTGVWAYNNESKSVAMLDFTRASDAPEPCPDKITLAQPAESSPAVTNKVNQNPDSEKDLEESVSKAALLEISLTDAGQNLPVDGEIKIFYKTELLASGKTVNGRFSTELINKPSIIVKASSGGYLTVKDSFLISANEPNILKEIKLTRLEEGKSVILENIRFEQGKYDLLEISHPELDKIVTMMKEYPEMEIEISGHTDNQGIHKKNVELSENRVKVVKNYLIKKGIKASRIQGVGYGGSRPVADNAKEDTRKLNRRVEFKIIKM